MYMFMYMTSDPANIKKATTINGNTYLGDDEMTLMWANPFRGQLEEEALKIETFLGPEIGTSEAHPLQWPE
jgi:hypothetical protein